MKHIVIFIAAVIFASSSVFAQTLDEDKNEVYTDIYSFEKADSFQSDGDYEKAIWFYINLFPNNEARVIQIAQTLASKIDTLDMGLLIKQSLAMYSAFDPAITTFESGVPNMDLEILRVKGSWADELIQKISPAAKSLSSAAEYNFRGLDKAKAGNYREAILDFDQAIEIKPTGQIYYNRAYVKSVLEDFTGAISDFDKTIEYEYRLVEAYFERGYCKDQINDLVGAIADYSKAVETDPNYADAYNNRAFTKYKMEEYEAAINDWDQAIAIDPNFAGAYVSRGFAKGELGDKLGACEDWTKAVELGFSEAKEFLERNCE